jgi:hypothetical protein
MNVVLSTNQFNKSYVYYEKPIENIIMENSKFIKLIYSTEDVMLYGIYIYLPMKSNKHEHHYNKIRITFDAENNKIWLANIYDIEANILNKYESSKRQKRIIHETLSSGIVKIYSNNEQQINGSNSNKSLIVKISGIWESTTEYGVTYKLLYV